MVVHGEYTAHIIAKRGLQTGNLYLFVFQLWTARFGVTASCGYIRLRESCLHVCGSSMGGFGVAGCGDLVCSGELVCHEKETYT